VHLSSNLWSSTLAVWRWRCCCLIAVSFYVPITIANNWMSNYIRARCATHWNIALRYSWFCCKLLRTNYRFVHNILSNIMIKQPSSSKHFFCLFVCLFACLFIYVFIYFFSNQFSVCQNMFVSWLTLFVSICWYIIHSIVVRILFILFLINTNRSYSYNRN
jgi:hypothetical protein